MNTVSLCVQHGVGFLSVWVILCFFGHWLMRVGSFHCKSNYWKNIRAIVPVGMCVSLIVGAAVLLHSLALLLIIAGDVELNPGPGMGKFDLVDSS